MKDAGQLNAEAKGKAAELFRTTPLTPDQISEETGLAITLIRQWMKEERWEKRVNYTKRNADRVRQKIATGGVADDNATAEEMERASDEQSQRYFGAVDQGFSNAVDIISKISGLIEGCDTGGKLKALAESNQKALATVREIAELNSDGEDDAMSSLVADLHDLADLATTDGDAQLHDLDEALGANVH
jgi:hypothetical protein